MIYKLCAILILLKSDKNHENCNFIESDIYSRMVPKGDKKVLIVVVL